MRDFKVVDVFSATSFRGNPVAVVLDAEGLSDSDMQAIARWTNLSETTFVLPATHDDADYLLRIFTPRSELPFAGHPTLGSAHAILEAGRIKAPAERLVQQCRQGLVPVTITQTGESRRLSLELPPATTAPLGCADIDTLEAILGQPIVRQYPPAIIDVGARWIVAQIDSPQRLLQLQPDLQSASRFDTRLQVTGVSLFARYPAGSETAIEVRSFAPSCGVEEDPVCGSGNGSIAVFQLLCGALPAGGTHYVASQGRCVGRAGRIDVSVSDSGRIQIGGACITSINGQLRSPRLPAEQTA